MDLISIFVRHCSLAPKQECHLRPVEAGNSLHFLRVGHHLMEWLSPADHPTGKPELAVECKGSVDKASRAG